MSCRIFHRFDKWRIRCEVPLWSDNFNHLAAGNQPVETVTYSDGKKRWTGCRADHDYKLIGKLIEQFRTCADCGLVKHRWTKVRV